MVTHGHFALSLGYQDGENGAGSWDDLEVYWPWVAGANSGEHCELWCELEETLRTLVRTVRTFGANSQCKLGEFGCELGAMFGAWCDSLINHKLAPATKLATIHQCSIAPGRMFHPRFVSNRNPAFLFWSFTSQSQCLLLVMPSLSGESSAPGARPQLKSQP